MYIKQAEKKLMETEYQIFEKKIIMASENFEKSIFLSLSLRKVQAQTQSIVFK